MGYETPTYSGKGLAIDAIYFLFSVNIFFAKFCVQLIFINIGIMFISPKICKSVCSKLLLVFQFVSYAIEIYLSRDIISFTV